MLIAVLYRMTDCADWPNRNDWYDLRGPYDPVVAVRRPERSVSPLASVVTISLQLETFVHEHGHAALRAILTEELGVELP